MASGLVQDLFERRVPQYVAIYLGASWAVIEFMAFLEDRFLLSPHLTNLVLVVLVLLLPTVVLFTYFHGRPGADRWRRIEKIFIPVNLAVVALVVLTGFSGKELGAVTTTVSTEDEEGNVVERAVPKSAFRKRVALFPLEAPPDSAWLGEAVAHALHTDLFQDLFLELRFQPHYVQLLEERGYSSATEIPRPLQREIARELDMDHFVEGAIRTAPEGFRLQVRLDDAERGDLVAEATFAGPDFFALVDSASLAIRRALELPAAHLAESQDVPVEEILTGSLEALHAYVEGVTAHFYTGDHAAAASEIERATLLDPTFADALFTLYGVRLLNGDGEGAREALEAAMDQLYRLPERLQFAVKAEYYALQEDLEKALAVQELRAELYPQDIQAYLAIAAIRRFRDDVPGVIDALEQALALDPSQSELLQQIGTLQLQLGRLDRAEEYFQRYVEAQPDRPEPYIDLGGLHLTAGDHERARESFERALLLDPGTVDALVGLAELARFTGQWDEAERQSAAAMRAARSPQARHIAALEMRRYRSWRGDFEAAADAQEQVDQAVREYMPPVYAAQMELIGLGVYVQGGRAEEARERLERLIRTQPAPVDRLIAPLGRTELWLALEEPDSALPHLRAAEAAVQELGYEVLARRTAYDRGRLHELRGEWREAAAAYHRELELAPSASSVGVRLGRAYRRLGELDRAESLLLESLAVRPADPEANHQLGLVYLEMERPEDAVRHLERAVEAWSLADPSFDDLRDARTRLDEARLRLRVREPRG